MNLKPPFIPYKVALTNFRSLKVFLNPNKFCLLALQKVFKRNPSKEIVRETPVKKYLSSISSIVNACSR